MKRKQTRVSKWLGCFLLLAVILWIVDSTQAKPPQDGPVLNCDVASIQAVVSPDVTIASAVQVSTPVPYCRVDGYIITHGPGPESGLVNFMVALPDSFNNRYLFSGLGGSAGYIHDPVTDFYAIFNTTGARLREGYAVATSDDGSQSPGCDYSFAWNRTKAFDWGQRGVHVSAVITQAITRAYYGLGTKQKKLYRYIIGCSGGGRSGNVSAMYDPEDFDGANIGCPGINPTNILFFGYLSDFIINNPNAWIPPALLVPFEQAVIQQFDGADGAIDGHIWDPTTLTFDPASLGIFNPLQLQLLQIIMNGMDVGGVTYPGFPPSNPTGWSSALTGGSTPPPWTTLPGVLQCFDTTTRGLFGPDYDFRTQFDFNDPNDMHMWVDAYKEVFSGSGNQEPAELDGFRRAGGKILYWHGVSDNAINVIDMIRFYNQLAQLQHGYGHTQTFARLFLVPGLFHGMGGPGPQDVPNQAMKALTEWVEHGKPPKEVVLHSRPTETPRTYLICAYPEVSVFLGGVENPEGLDVNDAANWVCRKP